MNMMISYQELVRTFLKSKHRSQFIKREGLKELAQLDLAAALRDICVKRNG